jgi:tyrosine-protein phosphatase SIW14
MATRTRFGMALLVFVGLLAAPAAAQQVVKENIPGIVNFAGVETTVACGGPVKPEGVAELKKRGFKAIVNLQLANEPTADVAGETAAAVAAGLNYVHVPFLLASPDPTAVDRFLKAVGDPANQPAYIHCGGGNRAAGLWMIKRVLIDRWAIDRATKEAEALGMTNPAMKTFALDYIQSHSR